MLSRLALTACLALSLTACAGVDDDEALTTDGLNDATGPLNAPAAVEVDAVTDDAVTAPPPELAEPVELEIAEPDEIEDAEEGVELDSDPQPEGVILNGTDAESVD